MMLHVGVPLRTIYRPAGIVSTSLTGDPCLGWVPCPPALPADLKAPGEDPPLRDIKAFGPGLCWVLGVQG